SRRRAEAALWRAAQAGGLAQSKTWRNFRQAAVHRGGSWTAVALYVRGVIDEAPDAFWKRDPSLDARSCCCGWVHMKEGVLRRDSDPIGRIRQRFYDQRRSALCVCFAAAKVIQNSLTKKRALHLHRFCHDLKKAIHVGFTVRTLRKLFKGINNESFCGCSRLYVG